MSEKDATLGIFEAIRRFVVDNFLLGAEDEVTADDSFIEQGIIDSTGIMELVAFIEQTFEITVDDTELTPENLDSLSRVAAFVQSKRVAATRS
jgi:acyl carrier protein